jgi:hypothetical protein
MVLILEGGVEMGVESEEDNEVGLLDVGVDETERFATVCNCNSAKVRSNSSLSPESSSDKKSDRPLREREVLWK